MAVASNTSISVSESNSVDVNTEVLVFSHETEADDLQGVYFEPTTSSRNAYQNPDRHPVSSSMYTNTLNQVLTQLNAMSLSGDSFSEFGVNLGTTGSRSCSSTTVVAHSSNQVQAVSRTCHVCGNTDKKSLRKTNKLKNKRQSKSFIQKVRQIFKRHPSQHSIANDSVQVQQQSLSSELDLQAPTTSHSQPQPNSSNTEAYEYSDEAKNMIESLKRLKDCPWYWGPLTREEAEEILVGKPDGSFLVRDSCNEKYILSLSFNIQGSTYHTRIEHCKGFFSFFCQPSSYGNLTIIDFIQRAMDNSKSGRFTYFLRPRGPGLQARPVHLIHPISRNQRVPSLQHLARFTILKNIRYDHIDLLPLPNPIKNYLREKQYYYESV